jgi:hypothetical protein
MSLFSGARQRAQRNATQRKHDDRPTRARERVARDACPAYSFFLPDEINRTTSWSLEQRVRR